MRIKCLRFSLPVCFDWPGMSEDAASRLCGGGEGRSPGTGEQVSKVLCQGTVVRRIIAALGRGSVQLFTVLVQNLSFTVKLKLTSF